MSKLIKRRLFTAEEYQEMGKAGILVAEDRVELIYGEIVAMSPIGDPHNAAVDRANKALVIAAGDHGIVRVQGSVRLNLYNEPQPDIVVLMPRDDFYAKKGAGPEDIILIVEIADSSLRYDQRVKARLYAETGVREYWLADINADCVFVHSSRLGRSYRLIRQVCRGDSLAAELLPECRIRVDQLLP